MPEKTPEEKGKIQFFSDKTGNFYQLLPTETIPVLRINGVPMQRFVNTDPLADTKSKVAALNPSGKVLEICTGLGYTAIEMAKRKNVKQVTTIEKDEEVLKMCKLNDASKELFESPKTEIINEDASQIMDNFKDESFDCILADPPTFKIAPELYQIVFYKELFRVLRRRGKMWHYAPNPGKESGKKFSESIIKKLQRAGFKEVVYHEASSGIMCLKQ